MTDLTDRTEAGTEAESRTERPMSFGRHLLTFVKELSVVVIGAVVVAALLRGFVAQAFMIPSESMENTLRVHNRVVVEKISSVKRGQVIVFADPGDWLPDKPTAEPGGVRKVFEWIGVLPDTSTNHLTKRVIGMPGDQVVCCDKQGKITVNDQPLDESSYLYREPDGAPVDPSDIPFSVTVPAGRVFVMGDHRDNSRDSRCHLNDDPSGPGGAGGSVRVKGDNGLVPVDLVVGRAVGVYWPIGDLGSLKIPATFGSVPPGESPAPATATITAGPDADC